MIYQPPYILGQMSNNKLKEGGQDQIKSLPWNKGMAKEGAKRARWDQVGLDPIA